MKVVDELVSARWVMPVVPRNTVFENYTIAIQDQKILDILPTKCAMKKYRAFKAAHLNDHVLMPGLINTHTHTPMVLFRGLAGELPLMKWLREYIWPAENTLICPKTVVVASRLAIAEMIRSGTTCFNDMYFYPLSTAEAVIQSGIRASIGFHILNVPFQDFKNEDDYLEKAVTFYQTRPDSDLLTWAIMPHASYTNSNSSLRRAAILAKELNLRIHTHAHETTHEINIDLKKYNKRPLVRLNDAGLLTDRTLLAHMVHLNEEDINLVCEKNTYITSCPASNMKLGSGFPGISKLMDKGITVSLGTDGAASNDNLDMFREMYLAALVAKGKHQNPTLFTSYEAIEAATINGARALGLSHRIGSLEKCKDADMIAIDLAHPQTSPVYNPIPLMVYAVNGMQVSDVWVKGQKLLTKTVLQTIDFDKTIADITQLKNKVFAHDLHQKKKNN